MEIDASDHPQVPSALLRATQAETELTFCSYNFFFFLSSLSKRVTKHPTVGNLWVLVQLFNLQMSDSWVRTWGISGRSPNHEREYHACSPALETHNDQNRKT